jgi:drug/metabolite transporter (DMT)-like permease
VRDLVKSLESSAVWALFFFTTVYGHVALKTAVNRVPGGAYRQVLAATATNFWGWSALVAWGLSSLLWALALSRHSLVTVNAVSALRFVLVGLAAWGLLSERITWSQAVGMALIAGGILLVR